MWFCDSLPSDLPDARIMLYGYDTQVLNSQSFQNLEDLGSGLRTTLQQLRYDNESQREDRFRPIIFVAHSLGGLIFKEALIQMKRDEKSHDLLRSIYGALFFGVPNQGMEISHLDPMILNQPNHSLIRSLGTDSDLLRKQFRAFVEAFDFYDSEIICFYETEESPTAVKVGYFYYITALLHYSTAKTP